MVQCLRRIPRIPVSGATVDLRTVPAGEAILLPPDLRAAEVYTDAAHATGPDGILVMYFDNGTVAELAGGTQVRVARNAELMVD